MLNNSILLVTSIPCKKSVFDISIKHSEYIQQEGGHLTGEKYMLYDGRM